MLLNDHEIKTLMQHGNLIRNGNLIKTSMGHLSGGISSFGYDALLGSTVLTFADTAAVILDPCSDKPLKFSAKEHDLTDGWELKPGEFCLGYLSETYDLPADITGVVRDKSTLARIGIAVQNTVLEAGWRGQVTIEISNHGPHRVLLRKGMPICQVQFHQGNAAQNPYKGKYYDSKGPTLPKAFNPQDRIHHNPERGRFLTAEQAEEQKSPKPRVKTAREHMKGKGEKWTDMTGDQSGEKPIQPMGFGPYND